MKNLLTTKIYKLNFSKTLLNKKLWIFLLFLFLLFFPKGGFKIQNIPITWGYLLLGIISIFWLLKKSKTIHKNHLYAYVLTIPFQLTLIISVFLFGFISIGPLIALIINCIILPIIVFISFSEYVNTLDLDYFFKILKKGILFIATYGIFLFFYKFFTGNFIEIPFLTINSSDMGMIEYKHINRGFLFKLISTYNNGNIYGICLLMLLPIYQFLEKKIFRKIIVITSLILTLSRTVWAGLIFLEIFFFLILKKDKKLSIKNVFAFILFLVSTLFIFIKYYHHFSFLFSIDNLLTLGGRTSNLSLPIKFFASDKFNTISEITYISIIQSFGIIGLIFFVLTMISPLIIYLIRKNKIRNIYSLYIILGLITYLICANIEGTFIYIPTMFFYLFLSSLLLRKKEKIPSI